MDIHEDSDRYDEPGYEEWAHDLWDPLEPEDEEHLQEEWAEEASERLCEELRVRMFEAEHGVKVLWTGHEYRVAGDGYACDTRIAFKDRKGRLVERLLPPLPPGVKVGVRLGCRALTESDYEMDADFNSEGGVDGVSVNLRPAARERVVAGVRPLLLGDLSTRSKVPATVSLSLLRRPVGRAPRHRVRRRVRRCARAPGSSDDGPEPEPPPLARFAPRRFRVPAFAGVES